MHIVPAYTPSVTLYTNDGQSRAFHSYAAALEELGIRWIRANVGKHFQQFEGTERLLGPSGEWEDRPIYLRACAIMRGDAGEAVTAADFEGLLKGPRRMYWWMRGFSTWNGEGPVPLTGRRRRGRFRRRLKTTQERRLAQTMDLDEPPPRAARNAHNLPDSRDDHGVAAREDISWKAYRREQWKGPRP